MKKELVDCPFCINAPEQIQKECFLCEGKLVCDKNNAIEFINNYFNYNRKCSIEMCETLATVLRIMGYDPFLISYLATEPLKCDGIQEYFQSMRLDNELLSELCHNKQAELNAKKIAHWLKWDPPEKRIDRLSRKRFLEKEGLYGS